MDIVGKRLYRGPSLFAACPSVVVTLEISRSESELLRQHDAAAIDRVPEILKEIPHRGALQKLQTLRSFSLEESMAVVSSAILNVLHPATKAVTIALDKSGERVHFAYPIWVARFADQACQAALEIVLSLYPKQVGSQVSGNWRRSPAEAWSWAFRTCGPLVKHRTLQEIIAYMEEADIPWLALDTYPMKKNLIQIGYGRHQRILNGTVAFESSGEGIGLSMSKVGSRQFLADLGLPVTTQLVVKTVEEARRAAGTIGFPVVLKKDRGSSGDNVYVNLRNEEELFRAFELLAHDPSHDKYKNNPIFVENHLSGNDYRITLINGSLVNALLRIPARVVGDGVSSIARLVELENRSPLRGSRALSSSALATLELKQPELDMLRRQGMEPGSIPSRGAEALLRSNANWSTGGTLETVTDRVHPDNVALARRVAEALQIDIIGVDVITEDISRSYLEGGLRIIEVNHSPGIFAYCEDDGKMVEQAHRLVEAFIPDWRNQSVPVVTVLDRELDTGTVAAMNKLLGAAGYIPGIACNQGLFIDGEQWSRNEDIDRRDPAFSVLRNTRIDLAVIERNTPDVLEFGVGSGGCDICMIGPQAPGVHRSPLWSAGIQSMAAAELLVRSARKGIIVWDDISTSFPHLKGAPAEKVMFAGKAALSYKARHWIDKGAGALTTQRLDSRSVNLRLQKGPLSSEYSVSDVSRFDEAELSGLLPAVAVMLSLGLSLGEAASLIGTCTGKSGQSGAYQRNARWQGSSRLSRERSER